MSHCESAYQLFEEFWQWRLRDSPETASFSGVHLYDDRLGDLSVDAYRKRKEKCEEFLLKADGLRGRTGSDEAEFNLLLLRDQLITFIEGHAHIGYLYCISYWEGPHIDFKTLISWMKFEKREDYQKYIKRLKGVPQMLATMEDVLNHGIRLGRTRHKMGLRGVLDGLENVIKTTKTSVLYSPFQDSNKSSSISEEEMNELRNEATLVIEDHVKPAFDRLADYLQNVYMKSLRPDIAISSLPEGRELYQALLKWHLSLNVTPEAVHELGLSEVKRIRAEMEEVIKSVGFTGTFKEFLHFLRTNPKFYFKSKQEALDAFNDLSENKIRPVLKKLFRNVPANKLIIEEYPSGRLITPMGYYASGNSDGSRPGVFYINTSNLAECPKYEMTTLCLHEGEPGHHLQSSYAMELDIPDFRRINDDMKYYAIPTRFPHYTAYLEGWGLYCEYLGRELGLYDDPYSMFGHLSYEMHRACRLVADTGIHMFGWQLDQVRELFLENTALAENIIDNEMVRYVTYPAQACTYKVGQMKIKQLREHAEKTLGDSFDVRDFHEEVLGCGRVPLYVLEAVIEKFIRKTQQPEGVERNSHFVS